MKIALKSPWVCIARSSGFLSVSVVRESREKREKEEKRGKREEREGEKKKKAGSGQWELPSSRPGFILLAVLFF